MGTKVYLSKVRLSFPDIWTAVQFDGKGDFKYGASFLTEPGSETDKAVQAAIQTEAQAKWPKKAAAMLETFRGNTQKFCYTKGDLKDYEGYAGMLVLSAKRKQSLGRPLILDQLKNPLQEADGKPYAGCYVNATVEVYAIDGQYTGVYAALLGIQFHSDGDAFSGGAIASADDFQSMEDGADAGALV